jgi:transcriptional regulator with XRE-family HTH domain
MLTSEQIRAARAMLRIEQRELAERSGVSLETVKRIERTPGPISAYTGTVDKLRRALETAGIEFSDGDQPGVRLKLARGGPTDRSE